MGWTALLRHRCAKMRSLERPRAAWCRASHRLCWKPLLEDVLFGTYIVHFGPIGWGVAMRETEGQHRDRTVREGDSLSCSARILCRRRTHQELASATYPTTELLYFSCILQERYNHTGQNHPAHLMRLVPVRRPSRLHYQRHREPCAREGGAFHHSLDQFGGPLGLVLRHLEEQLVMDLEEHTRAEPGAGEGGGEADHRALDDVGGGGLERGVDRLALGRLAAPGIGGADGGDVAFAPR